MGRGFKATTLAVGLVVATALGGPASAQNGADKPDPRRADAARIVLDPNPMSDPKGDDDIQKMSDAYQPRGLDFGEFTLLPQLEVEESYNSNVFAEEHGAESDFITTVRPEMRLRSRLPEHALNAFAYLEYKHFATFTGDDVLDGEVFADGRYDLSRTSSLSATVDFYSKHEDRGTSDDVEGTEPTPTRGFGGSVGGRTQQGLYTFETLAAARRLNFDDVPTSSGVEVNNDDRDRTQFEGYLRGSYEMFPGYAAVAKVTANSRLYDTASDDFGFERDSYGGRVEGGIGVDLTQLIRGDFLVGYLYQNYEDPRLSDPQGVAVRAALNWTPSRLTLVVMALERSVEETTVSSASGIIRNAASVLVRHEMARNVLLSGFGGVYYDEYDGTSDSAVASEVYARVTYAFTPEIYLSGQVGYKIKESDIPDASYQQTVVGLRLGLRY